MELKMKVLNENCMPSKAHEDDAGIDLRANIKSLISVSQHSVALISTGICVSVPKGYMGEIRPRSGLNAKGITSMLGTVDSGYTGELKVALSNITDVPFHVNPYDRIAQLVIVPIAEITKIKVVEELDKSERGDAGFGSTGLA